MTIEPSFIISVAFGIVLALIQWSLKRNITELDEKNKQQDKRIDYVETGMEQNRTDIKVNTKVDEIMREWIEEQRKENSKFMEQMFSQMKSVFEMQYNELKERLNKLEINEQKRKGVE